MVDSAPQNSQKKDPDLVEKGAWGEVRYAARTSGKREAKAWLESDEANDFGFPALFQRMAAFGKIHNPEIFRPLDKRRGIWEFKKPGHRILAFQDGKAWYLTHHYPKKSKKCPQREIDRAVAIKDEHLTKKQQKKKKNGG